MKIFENLEKAGWLSALFVLLSFSSCNYLNVVPPETVDIDDTMINSEATLKFLYSCYSPIEYGNNLIPILYSAFDVAADDYVASQESVYALSLVQWGQMTAIKADDWNEKDTPLYPWKWIYTGIGQCNLFLDLLDKLNPPITEETKRLYKAEATFLKGYYHMRALQLFGPIPIIDKHISQNISINDMPGRSHFDYCVDYICGLFDEAAKVLPATQNAQNFGRATSVAAKALKGRLLLYAASPLWNSADTPLAGWKNTNYETPGYGKELVKSTYDIEKWKKALIANEEALKAARDAGYHLFTIEESEALRQQQGVALPKVPGNNISEEFQQRVMMFRYAITARPTEGNRENLWGTLYSGTIPIYAHVPHYVLTTDNKKDQGAWGNLGPTLYTVEHFYTNKGRIPEDDDSFAKREEWLQSAGLSSNPDIIKLHVGREARFYSWISFDGDEYSSYIVNAGSPLVVDMKNPEKQGYNTGKFGSTNYTPTGYLLKKTVPPNIYWRKSDGNNNRDDVKYPLPLIRMAELYLSLAECQLKTGDESGALENLNEIRERAGVPKLTTSTIPSGKTLLDCILEERFIELFQEGNRYHDIRRYLKGRERLNSSSYEGLNGMFKNPTFEEFNRRTIINQPFTWDDRMYVLPVPTSEIYANPQMVQAPNY